MERLLLRHSNVPAVLSPVPLQPSVHVHLLHSGNAGEDSCYGLGLQEGGYICVRGHVAANLQTQHKLRLKWQKQKLSLLPDRKTVHSV